MSRATAAPSATGGAPVVARTGSGSVAAPAPVASRSRSALNGALEGTPGRMRVLAFVAAVVAAAFGLVGAMSLWSSAGALERADHNTAQVVRIQGIYADLVRADADATSSFLVGGIEDPAQRADYDASLDRVATGIADAADAQPADSEALGALNAAVQDYAATIEEARVYNRQGLPVGAQYLSGASSELRTDILPIVKTLVDANKARADAEFDASSRLLTLILTGLGALALLVLVMVWLARRTHRYLNPSMFVGSLVVLGALAIGIVTLAGVGSQVQAVRNSSFAYTVKLADARTAAYDAKSNESLTLIARGSGQAYEKAWQTQSDSLLSSLAALDGTTQSRLRGEWDAYKTLHQAIRKADDGGDWDGAVAQALKTGPGTANAAFSTFAADADQSLKTFGDDTSRSLLGPVTWVTILGWLLLALCAGAAVLMLRGMGQRIEEYR
jgi:hypothetical protein